MAPILQQATACRSRPEESKFPARVFNPRRCVSVLLTAIPKTVRSRERAMGSVDSGGYKVYLNVRHMLETASSCVMCREKTMRYSWFVIDPDNNNNTDACKEKEHINNTDDAGGACENQELPLPLVHSMCGIDSTWFSTSVCLGSTIYLLGGIKSHEYSFFEGVCMSSTMWSIDTDDERDKWSERCQFTPRALYSAVAVGDQKIFICGGTGCDFSADMLPEVYDMKSNSWSEVPEIGSISSSCIGACVFLDDPLVLPNKTILLHVVTGAKTACLCSYDLKTKELKIFDASFGRIGSFQPVLSGTTLFAIKGIFLYGYDLRCRKWLPERVRFSGEGEMFPCADLDGYLPNTHLLSVGPGKLCVIWSYIGSCDWPLYVHISKFEVASDEHGLVAQLVGSKKVFKFPKGAAELKVCLALVPRRGRKKE